MKPTATVISTDVKALLEPGAKILVTNQLDPSLNGVYVFGRITKPRNRRAKEKAK